MPSLAEKHATYYDKMYAESASYSLPYNRSHYYFLWSVIVDRIRRSRARSVLEVGCGPGQFASYLLDTCSVKYRGFDFSQEAVRIATERLPQAEFFVADARFAEHYTSTEYDVIVCTEVLEHVDADLDIVSHFRPGTRCLCSVPSFDFDSHVRWFSSDSEVLDRYGSFFEKLDVAMFKSPVCDNDFFFLLDGIRKSAPSAVA
jgi:2-polyprenyl-3-methyl-5-hydroxy-6-metoxy-1,4-benzoquinol methylase